MKIEMLKLIFFFFKQSFGFSWKSQESTWTVRCVIAFLRGYIVTLH